MLAPSPVDSAEVGARPRASRAAVPQVPAADSGAGHGDPARVRLDQLRLLVDGDQVRDRRAATRKGGRGRVADRAIHTPDFAAARLRFAAAGRRDRRRAAPHRVPEASAAGAGGDRHRAARRRRAARRSRSRASEWTSSASGKDRSQEPAFRNARRGQPWHGPVYFRKETEPYMTIAMRSGSDAGPVTIADVNLKFIWDVVSRIKIGDKGKAYVVDGNGFLIADPDIGLVLRKTDLSHLPHVKAAGAKQELRRARDALRRSRGHAGADVVRADRIARLESVRRAAGRHRVRKAQRLGPQYAAPAGGGPRCSPPSARCGWRAGWCARSARWTRARGGSAPAISISRSSCAPATSSRGSPISSTG